MKTIFLAMLLLLTEITFAQSSALRQKQFNLEKGLALSGYDPVSYFQKNPTKGSKTYVVVYEGVTYQFSSAANAETFKNPAAYEPQYGGWCAYAMGAANGEKVEINPETYKIINGKLYLFYNKLFNNTLSDWNKDEGNLKIKADKNWQRVSAQ